ncbi:MAG: hypothetical protein Q4F98_06125, partial [Lachnospiraceae bacterium]|nr:hypothetical protein [Lachnospiraceae bacterium]
PFPFLLIVGIPLRIPFLLFLTFGIPPRISSPNQATATPIAPQQAAARPHRITTRPNQATASPNRIITSPNQAFFNTNRYQ